MLTRKVKAATTPGARPARRLAALQLVAIEQLFRLVVPCQTPRGTHPRGRPTALSRLKYCAGSARRGEAVLGWSRAAVELGLHEKPTGIVCLSAHAAFSGDKLWEKKHPEASDARRALAQSHSQQDPTFHTTLSFIRLTAAEALKRLRAQGFAEEVLPSASTISWSSQRVHPLWRTVS